MTCTNSSLHKVSVSLGLLNQSLDIFTDILVVSIPVIILRRAKIKKRQKLALSFFLCLSIVMIIITIVRISKISNSTKTEMVWHICLQALEGCVALLMASIMAFRSIFVSQEMRNSGQKRWAPSSSWLQSAKQRKTSKEGMRNGDQLPSVPQATFTTMKRYFRGHGGTADGSTTLNSETCDSGRNDGTSLSETSGQQDQNV